MLSIDSDIRDDLLLAESRPLTVYEIAFPTHTLYLSSQAVTWGGNDYEARVLKSTPIVEEIGKRANEVSITVDNASRFLVQYIEPEDRLTGVRVTIRTLMRDSSMVPRAGSHVPFIGVLRKPKRVKGNTIVLRANRIDDRRDLAAPRRSPHVSCPWQFKDGINCSYAGVETECNRLLSDCSTYSQLHEHGGFPGAAPSPVQAVINQANIGPSGIAPFWLLVGQRQRSAEIAEFAEDEAVSEEDTRELSIPLLYGRKLIRPPLFQVGLMQDSGGNRNHIGRFLAISEGPIEGLVNWYDTDELITPRTNTDWAGPAHPRDGLYYRVGSVGYLGTDDYEASQAQLRFQNIDPFSPDGVAYSRTAYATHIKSLDTGEDDYSPPYLDVKGIVCQRYDSGGAKLDGGSPVWTRNPVWHAVDFMLNPRYGLGDVLSESDMDWQTIASHAAYCDDVVTGNSVAVSANGDGFEFYTVDNIGDLERGMTVELSDGTPQSAEVVRIVDDVTVELDVSQDVAVGTWTITPKIPRFTNDLYLTRKDTASKVLRMILSSCRGFLAMRDDGKIAVKTERDEATTSGSYKDWSVGTIEADVGPSILLAGVNGTPQTYSTAVTPGLYRVQVETSKAAGHRQYLSDRYGNVLLDQQSISVATRNVAYGIVEALDGSLDIVVGDCPANSDGTTLRVVKAWPLATAAPRGIVKDSLDWITDSDDNGVNRIAVRYIDPDGNSQPLDLTDWDHAATHPIKSKSISLDGVDNGDQAWRMADVELQKHRTLRSGGKCTLSPLSLEIELGDIIYVTHGDTGWEQRLKRVTKLERYGLGDQKELCTKVTLKDYDPLIYPGGQPPQRHRPLTGSVTVTLVATNVNGLIELSWTLGMPSSTGPLLGFIVLKSDASIAGDFSNGTILARRLRQTTFTYTPTESEYGEELFFTVVARFARASSMSNEVPLEAIGITDVDVDPTIDAEREGQQLVAYGSFQSGWERDEPLISETNPTIEAANVGGGYDNPTDGNNGSESDFASATVTIGGTENKSHIYSFPAGAASIEGDFMVKLGGIKPGRYGRQNVYYSIDGGSSWVLFDSHLGSLSEKTSGAVTADNWDKLKILVEAIISGPSGSITGRLYDCAFREFVPPYSGFGQEGDVTYGYLLGTGALGAELLRSYPGVDPTPNEVVHAANSNNVLQCIVRAPDGNPDFPLIVLIRDEATGAQWTVGTFLGPDFDGANWKPLSARWIPGTDVVGEDLQIVCRSNTNNVIHIDQIGISRGARVNSWTPHRDEIGFNERSRVASWDSGKWSGTRGGSV